MFALLIGFLYLNQFREGLIDARIQSLETQSEIIASAIASSATVDTDAITVDPEKLLKLAPGQSYGVDEETKPGLEFSINPDRVGPLLRLLVSPTRTRARIYDRDGYMLLDSRSIAARANILRNDLPPPGQDEGPQWLDGLRNLLHGRFNTQRLPLYEDIGVANGRGYPGSGQRAGGQVEILRAGQCARRDGDLRRHADPALPLGARRTAAFNPGAGH